METGLNPPALKLSPWLPSFCQSLFQVPLPGRPRAQPPASQWVLDSYLQWPEAMPILSHTCHICVTLTYCHTPTRCMWASRGRPPLAFVPEVLKCAPLVWELIPLLPFPLGSG